jgi:hypothetical protein
VIAVTRNLLCELESPLPERGVVDEDLRVDASVDPFDERILERFVLGVSVIEHQSRRRAGRQRVERKAGKDGGGRREERTPSASASQRRHQQRRPSS